MAYQMSLQELLLKNRGQNYVTAAKDMHTAIYAIFSIDGLYRSCIHGEVVKNILNTSVRFLKHREMSKRWFGRCFS